VLAPVCVAVPRRWSPRPARWSAATTTTATTRQRVVLVTHESFVMSEELQQQFEDESGYDLVVKASGDAGALTNKLVLTKDDPTGDAVFGIDNTFGSRAIDEGVLAPYAASCPAARTRTRSRATTTTTSPRSTPATCASTSTTRGSPTTASRAADPRRPGRPGVQRPVRHPGATTSSPGLAFLLATDRGVRRGRLAGLLDAVDGQRHQAHPGMVGRLRGRTSPRAAGGGDRPIVLSYDSSPAFTTDGSGGTTTSALLDTCFRQIEYAGVLAGARQPRGLRRPWSTSC
jgi:thiamine transport system substrate-binding protein